ncbi:Asp23/Gls24 family envelope stress response protein [Isobaculum melis]|uniref:PadR family transcriptional regulator, regulatory protein PadR n=1 Tax=Isobaculum melis TaxID=142588 RepID=A0A1H9TWP0_9LACT|nr:Asp23/Gls24 family envelope stress response protein [Isobaculum melis]SES01529.1 PadR family transcriptional regulator, regulatory protein PadR [Isobaculum melis]
MAEETNLTLKNEKTSLGQIELAPEVVEIIAGIATTEVEGVYAMRGNIASGVVELFGKKNHGKGIRLTMDEAGIKVDVYCYFNYGVSVPKVAQAIQENVRQQLFFMTDLELAEVNVHIVGVIPEKKDLKNLPTFEDGEDA